MLPAHQITPRRAPTKKKHFLLVGFPTQAPWEAVAMATSQVVCVCVCVCVMSDSPSHRLHPTPTIDTTSTTPITAVPSHRLIAACLADNQRLQSPGLA
ncbi:unnamed protein product [Arctogadus glacialis]